MKTKKLLLSLLCLISTSVPAQRLTLDNAIEIAQENSLDAQSTNSSWCIGKNRMYYFLGAHKQRVTKNPMAEGWLQHIKRQKHKKIK